MIFINNIDSKLNIKNPIVTFGAFDGLHLGHQQVIKTVNNLAAEHNGKSVVITFNPHPRIFFGHNIKLLTLHREKIAILNKLNVDILIEIPFTNEFSKLSALQFIELINNILEPHTIVIGYDNGFGSNREGDTLLLQNIASNYNFNVKSVNELKIKNISVSSTKVRNFINIGKIETATKLLGYYYTISGVVIKGNQIGRTIGFPTANIQIPLQKAIPSIGVYATLATYKNKTYKSMTNVGYRPTVNGNLLNIEVNIFNFNSNLYDENISISFVKKIRDEVKFINLDKLKDQISKDKKESLKILNNTITNIVFNN